MLYRWYYVQHTAFDNLLRVRQTNHEVEYIGSASCLVMVGALAQYQIPV